MDRSLLVGLTERSVQVAGDGFVETRNFFFNGAGRLWIVQIVVVWTNGTTTETSAIIDGDVFSWGGVVRYPDDKTFINASASADGHVTITWSKPPDQPRDDTSWRYTADGYAEVTHKAVGGFAGGVGIGETDWTVDPEGRVVSDVRDHLIVVDEGPPKTWKEVDTVRAKDGTVTTHTRIVNTETGEVILDEETVVHFDPNPMPPINGTKPTKPVPRPGTGGEPTVDVVVPTTRGPDPSITGGGGWIGIGGPPEVEHITDWWYESPDGRVTYLGSTLKTKKE